jgi:hypothetical protein
MLPDRHDIVTVSLDLLSVTGIAQKRRVFVNAAPKVWHYGVAKLCVCDHGTAMAKYA